MTVFEHFSHKMTIFHEIRREATTRIIQRAIVEFEDAESHGTVTMRQEDLLKKLQALELKHYKIESVDLSYQVWGVLWQICFFDTALMERSLLEVLLTNA